MYTMAMRHLSKHHSCCAIIAPPRGQTDAHAVHQRKRPWKQADSLLGARKFRALMLLSAGDG